MLNNRNIKRDSARSPFCYIKNVKYTIQLISERGERLNNRIKEYRKSKGVTQEELARAAEVTRQTIISLENGKYNASLQLAHKLAKFFGVDIEDLFIFDED